MRERNREERANKNQAVDDISRRGKLAFAPELGGTYSVFTTRPLSNAIIHYCITDVALMPAIYARLRHSFDTWDKNNVVRAVGRQGMKREVGEYVFNMLNTSERRVFVSQLESKLSPRCWWRRWQAEGDRRREEEGWKLTVAHRIRSKIPFQGP